MTAPARLAPFLVALLLAGCLEQRSDDDPAGAAGCSAFLAPEDVGVNAPSEGGPGPRLLGLTLGGGGQSFTAWWPGEANGTVDVVRLRSPAGSPQVRLHAPADRDVHLLAASDADRDWAVALTVQRGSGALDLALTDPVAGSVAGTWGTPAAIGFGPQGPTWQPQALVGLGDGVRLVSLDLELAWDNGPAGGADFGIAVASGPSSFQYQNGAYQATPGPQNEARHLGADDLAGFGWGNGTAALAGPSMSTGGFATTGIAYTLAWSADLADPDGTEGDVCARLGPVRIVDATEA